MTARPDPKVLRDASNAIRSARKRVAAELVGLEATLDDQRSRYHGRLGRVENVVPDAEHGLRALLMIYYKGTRRVMNGDGESRAYRPLNQLRFGS